MRSERVEIGPHGATQRSSNPREGGFFTKLRAKTPRKLITSRSGDTVVHEEKGGLNFLYTLLREVLAGSGLAVNLLPSSRGDQQDSRHEE